MLGRANESNPDPSAALACGTATMLALYSREKTGKGQYVETTMLCGNLYAKGMIASRTRASRSAQRWTGI